MASPAPAIAVLALCCFLVLSLGLVDGAAVGYDPAASDGHGGSAEADAAEAAAAAACSLSFERFAFTRSSAVSTRFRSHLPHTCPPGCVARVNDSLAVYGSYPYTNDSSICLAAVHCGVLADARGGTVYPTPFYAADWSGASSQTIFPHHSSGGRLSNGLLSRDVPPSTYDAPSLSGSRSWIPRGRGDFFPQRQQAPFSPRAGHAVLDNPWCPMERREMYVVVGGHNETHYMNGADTAALPSSSPRTRLVRLCLSDIL